MSIHLFEEIIDNSLLEYSDKSSYELYKSIVLDPEDNEFKVIQGTFRDKKDAYERLKKHGYVVRKTFEKKVFDWIEDNAKNNIEAYLMFSTAFSKWRGNNILSDYYVKLLNDIPKLNREKIKGNPDTIGKESVLQEVYVSPVVDAYGAQAHTVRIYPVLEDDTRDPKYPEGIQLEKIDTFPTDDIKKKFDDPNFFRSMWKLINLDKLNYPKFDVRLDNDEPIRLPKQFFLAGYATKNKNPHYVWGPKSRTIQGNLNERLKFIRSQIKKAEEDLIFDVDGNVKIEIENLKNQEKQLINDINKARLSSKVDYTPEEKAERDRLNRLSTDIQTKANWEKYGIASHDDVYKKQSEIYKDLDDIKHNAEKRNGNIVNKLDIAIADLKQQIDTYGISSVDKELDKRNQAKAQLDKLEKLRKNMQNWKQPRISTDDNSQIQSNAEKMANEWAFNKASGTKGYRAKFSNGNVKEESAIPRVNAYNPTLYVNSGADNVSANIPQDGVIMNPGAIPMSGTFMEAWLHGKLNQKLFDGKTLRQDVREALLKIAKVFEGTLDLNIEPVDIYFTGSSANYTYNEQSDLDLHLVYDFEKVGVNAEILTSYMIAKKQIFNNNYDIKVKGVPVEVGVENINTPIVSTAIYSIKENKWILQPVETEHKTPMPDMKKYHEIVQEIEQAIESQDSIVIGKMWDKLYEIRKTGLATEGELGQSNAMFKKLRNLGYLDRLKTAYYDTASSELSLESILNKIKKVS